MTLPQTALDALAEELVEAHRTRRLIRRITLRHPEATIEDAYALQTRWRDLELGRGRRLVGRKIGLTSAALQAAHGITEPDFGVMLDDAVVGTGAVLEADRFTDVRVEVELAFALSAPLEGPGCTLADVLRATEHVTPALEVLDAHVELDGRTIVDTIADNAAFGAMVLGDRSVRPDDADLRWVPALLHRNGTIEETGVAAGVLGHPGRSVAWLANKLSAHGERLEAGEIVLSGSLVRPVRVERGDTVLADCGGLGTVSCRFV